MNKGLTRLCLCGLLLLAVCPVLATSSLASDLPIVVSVSVPPQAYLVERIGEDRVEIHVLVPPGASPATYEPSPHQLVALGKSSLYVAVGHPDFLFEQRHLQRLLEVSPGMPLVDMSADTEASCLPEEHRDSEEDPHIRLSLRQMRSAASDIAAALDRLDPAGTPQYSQNLEDLLSDIDRLDLEIAALMVGKQGRPFMVFHPAWSHFACEYGLRQMAIEAGGKEPGPAQLVKTLEEARDEGIQVIFVQHGFSDRSARVIAAELGAKVESLDPLARDWLENLRYSAHRIASAIH